MYAGRVVEYADKTSLFTCPGIPKTVGLFDSVPDLEDDKEELNGHSRTDAGPHEPSRGARTFHPRCRFAVEACRLRKPAMKEVAPGHFVACPVRAKMLRESSGEERRKRRETRMKTDKQKPTPYIEVRGLKKIFLHQARQLHAVGG